MSLSAMQFLPSPAQFANPLFRGACACVTSDDVPWYCSHLYSCWKVLTQEEAKVVV